MASQKSSVKETMLRAVSMMVAFSWMMLSQSKEVSRLRVRTSESLPTVSAARMLNPFSK